MKAREYKVSEAVKTHFELDKAIKAAHELQDQVLKGARRFEPRCSLEDSSSESEYEGTDDESPMDIDNEFSAFVGDRNFPSVARKKPSASGSPIGSDDSPPGLSLPSVLPSRDQRSIFPRPLKFNPAVMDQRPMRPIGWQANRSTFKKKVRRQQQAGTTDKAKSIAASKLFKAQHRVVSTDINISTLKANSCLMGKEQKVYTLEELKEQGYEVVGWEGVNPKPFLSNNGEIFILPAGRPTDGSFVDDLKSVEGLLKEASDKVPVRAAKKKPPRRGLYPVLTAGISYGGGSKRPREMKIHSKKDKILLDRLEESKGMKRLGGYINRQMQVFAPDLWSFSKTILNIFEVQNDGVRRHFPGHPFASTTFNLGPVVTTFPHKDMKNLSWGWCAITSFGDYDPKKGGHLVLWDLKVVLEFPPYSTIFIPSAIVMHSNTAVAEGETRYSVTQYTSGGLFGWNAHGNMPYPQAKEVAEWWEKPKHMFSKFSDLLGASQQ